MIWRRCLSASSSISLVLDSFHSEERRPSSLGDWTPLAFVKCFRGLTIKARLAVS